MCTVDSKIVLNAKRFFANLGLLLFTITSTMAQNALNDSVPYQDAPILSAPISGQFIDQTGNAELQMDCDWPTLMRMIRDLEERISGALEVDTTYGVFVSGEVIGNTINMWHDCTALRDSVLSLQIQLDEALAGEPGMATLLVGNIAQSVASLKGAVIDDGNAALQSWGFIYGTDALLSSPDSVNVPFGSYQSFLDTSALDTGRYEYQLTGLSRYTQYYYSAVGANDEGPGYGDTLSFYTLPDLPSGFTLDTSDVTSTSATLKAFIDDDGGKNLDSSGFVWNTSNFVSLSDAASSQLSNNALTFTDDDSAGFTLSVAGLTRYTDYYFNAFAANSAGKDSAETTMTFKTLPTVATFDTLLFAPAGVQSSGSFETDSNGDPIPVGQDTLFAIIDDDGGNIDSFEISVGTSATSMQAGSGNGVTLLPNMIGDSIAATLVLSEVGAKYFGAATATNTRGIAYSDTIAFFTLAAVSSDSTSGADTTSLNFHGSTAFLNTTPSAVGFRYGTSIDLTGAADTSLTLSADSTFTFELSDAVYGENYYYTAYSSNPSGTAYGDTLFGTTKVKVVTDSAALVNGSFTLAGHAEYAAAVPSSTRFYWGDSIGNLDQTTYATLGPDSAFFGVPAIEGGKNYFFAAAAENSAGLSLGDTLAITTPVDVTSEQLGMPRWTDFDSLVVPNLGADTAKMLTQSPTGTGSVVALIRTQVQQGIAGEFSDETEDTATLYPGLTILSIDSSDLAIDTTLVLDSAFYWFGTIANYNLLEMTAASSNAVAVGSPLYGSNTWQHETTYPAWSTPTERTGRIDLFRKSNSGIWSHHPIYEGVAGDFAGKSVKLSEDGSVVAAQTKSAQRFYEAANYGSRQIERPDSVPGEVQVWKYDETSDSWAPRGNPIHGDNGSYINVHRQTSTSTEGCEKVESVENWANQWDGVELSNDGNTLVLGSQISTPSRDTLWTNSIYCGFGGAQPHQQMLATGTIKVFRWNDVTNDWQQLGQNIYGDTITAYDEFNYLDPTWQDLVYVGGAGTFWLSGDGDNLFVTKTKVEPADYANFVYYPKFEKWVSWYQFDGTSFTLVQDSLLKNTASYAYELPYFENVGASEDGRSWRMQLADFYNYTNGSPSRLLTDYHWNADSLDFVANEDRGTVILGGVNYDFRTGNLNQFPLDTLHVVSLVPDTTDADWSPFGLEEQSFKVKKLIYRVPPEEIAPTATSIQFGGIADYGNAAPNILGFAYATNDSLGGADTLSTVFDADTVSFNRNVEGLTAGTTYYFAALAENAGGTAYGDTIEVATKVGVTTTSSTEGFAGSLEYSSAPLTDAGFIFGFDSSLSNETTLNLTFNSDSTIVSAAYVPEDVSQIGQTIYYAAYATNDGGTAYGDTLSYLVSPTMTITAAEVSDGEASSDATLSLTFTSVATTTDFVEADITVTNGTISSFAGSGTTYTATFTPDDYGACTINVAGSTFTDDAGTDNSAADEFNWVYEEYTPQ